MFTQSVLTAPWCGLSIGLLEQTKSKGLFGKPRISLGIFWATECALVSNTRSQSVTLITKLNISELQFIQITFATSKGNEPLSKQYIFQIYSDDDEGPFEPLASCMARSTATISLTQWAESCTFILRK
ncbi:hypothetical protein V6N12_061661 [Hibiscus sabdariffa]|uniref:F5/8 type C domain-containing protein n=1 Tax=Hibiscus sabdariffa TaxID=183260 RepID=A0ABR2DXP7_9ROSI